MKADVKGRKDAGNRTRCFICPRWYSIDRAGEEGERQKAKGRKGRRFKGKELSWGRLAVWHKERRGSGGGRRVERKGVLMLFVAGLFVCLLFVLICTCLLLQSRWGACRGWRSCGIDVRGSSCIRRRR